MKMLFFTIMHKHLQHYSPFFIKPLSSISRATKPKTTKTVSPRKKKQPPPSPSPQALSAVADFLIKECGVSITDIAHYAKRFEGIISHRSTDNLRSSLQTLRDFGFTVEQLSVIITRYPLLLKFNTDILQEKLEGLRAFAFPHDMVLRMLMRRPNILSYALHRTIIPKVEALTDVFGGRENLAKAFEKFPRLLTASIESHVIPSIRVLKASGIMDEDLQFLILRNPAVLIYSEETIRAKLQFLHRLCMVEGKFSSRVFSRIVRVCTMYSDQTLKQKLRNLEVLGFEEEEVQVMLTKYPFLMECSYQKLQKNMDFLVSRVGYAGIVRHPSLLKLSLENSLRPRYEVLQYLRKVDPLVSLPPLDRILSLSHKAFLDRNHPFGLFLFRETKKFIGLLYDGLRGLDSPGPSLLCHKNSYNS